MFALRRREFVSALVSLHQRLIVVFLFILLHKSLVCVLIMAAVIEISYLNPMQLFIELEIRAMFGIFEAFIVEVDAFLDKLADILVLNFVVLFIRVIFILIGLDKRIFDWSFDILDFFFCTFNYLRNRVYFLYHGFQVFYAA